MRFSLISASAVATLVLVGATSLSGAMAFAKEAHHPVHATAKHVVQHSKTKKPVTKKPAVATIEYAHANLIGVGKSKAHGSVLLVLNEKAKLLTVTESVWGLTKGLHPTHIHHDVNGKATGILYPLTNLNASAKGYAHAVTTIKDVSSIALGNKWIVNVHVSPKNFAVVADGVVVAGH